MPDAALESRSSINDASTVGHARPRARLRSAIATRVTRITKSGARTVGNTARTVAARSTVAARAVARRSRDAFDKAYERKLPAARANVLRLRTAHPDFSPAQVMHVLEKDLSERENAQGVDFNSAVALFVVSAAEVQGDAVAHPVRLHRLLDAIVVVDSRAAKLATRYGGLAASLILAKFSAGQKVAALSASALAKVSWVPRVLAIAGIRNAGRSSAARAAIAATRAVLGPIPADWPDSR